MIELSPDEYPLACSLLVNVMVSGPDTIQPFVDMLSPTGVRQLLDELRDIEETHFPSINVREVFNEVRRYTHVKEN